MWLSACVGNFRVRMNDQSIICYQRQYVVVQARVPFGVTWVVAHAVIEALKPVVKYFVLNQPRGY